MLKTIPSILAQIVEQKKLELTQRVDGLERRAEASVQQRRDFLGALTSRKPAIIAEIKQASPSKGVIAENFEPATMAKAYEQGGAAALSVLTDEKHFHGSLSHLEAARAAVSLAVLRKDFTIDRYHVQQAAAHGADAILLIAAILSEREMREFRELAESYRMAAIVEVHDEDELGPALASGARIVGVNNRDLRTFEVDLATTERLAPRVPNGVTLVAESGFFTRMDIRRLEACGVSAVLIGEALVTADDAGAKIRELFR